MEGKLPDPQRDRPKNLHKNPCFDWVFQQKTRKQLGICLLGGWGSHLGLQVVGYGGFVRINPILKGLTMVTNHLNKSWPNPPSRWGGANRPWVPAFARDFDKGFKSHFSFVTHVKYIVYFWKKVQTCDQVWTKKQLFCPKRLKGFLILK